MGFFFYAQITDVSFAFDVCGFAHYATFDSKNSDCLAIWG